MRSRDHRTRLDGSAVISGFSKSEGSDPRPLPAPVKWWECWIMVTCLADVFTVTPGLILNFNNQ